MTETAVPVPKYHRLKEALLECMADGALPPGALIPSEPELCQEFGVSRITVRRAIGDLVHEGKLRAVQGKGTFVVKPKLEERFVQRAFGIYDDMQRRGLRLETTMLRQEVVPATPEVEARLRVPRGEPMHLLERVRSVEGEKLLLSTTYIPEALCPGLVKDDLSSGSLYHLLREKYGLVIARGERSLEAVAAGQWEARLLEVALASPLLLLDTIAYLPDGQPLEYSRVLQRGDRARIEVEFLPTPDGS
jgi:GntR family transcriptional regulator